MICLSNGHSFEYMAASGALAYDGKGWPWEWPIRWAGLLNPFLFTVVTKSLTLKPRKGNLRWYNPLRCVRFIPGGAINAVGLANPGIDWWSAKIGPAVSRKKIPIVVSIFGDTMVELVKMAYALNKFDIVALELNCSCPNVSRSLDLNRDDPEFVVACCRILNKTSRFPIIAKLSVMHNVEEIASKLEGTVEAISINSVPWSYAFPLQNSPLGKFGGGAISGKAAQPFNWSLVKRIVKITSIPVIGPGVWDFQDILALRNMGAKAVSFGSVFLRYPWRPTRFVTRDMRS